MAGFEARPFDRESSVATTRPVFYLLMTDANESLNLVKCKEKSPTKNCVIVRRCSLLKVRHVNGWNNYDKEQVS